MSALLIGALWCATGQPVRAQQSGEFILRAPAASIQAIAARNGLTVIRQLDGRDVFLVVSSGSISTSSSLLSSMMGVGAGGAQATLVAVQSDPDVQSFEQNAVVVTPEVASAFNLNGSTVSILDALSDRSLVNFFNAQAWSQYVNQPATAAIKLAAGRQASGTGAGIVAIIDTGVDPTHPVLAGSLVAGYDFVHEIPGQASEWSDLDGSVVSILDGSAVSILDSARVVSLNGSTVAILDQATAATLNPGLLPRAFGHGTMVAGLVHLVAPTAQIMPLKAFKADGTSTVFDVVRAIYYAVDNGARVINMSFSASASSPEIAHAIDVATSRGVICVAAAGNLGQETLVYPGALRNVVGVGSTSSAEPPIQSSFTNYGDALVSLGAPGEAVITTYPGGHYAGVWGTSFSTPLTAGGAAVLLQVDPTLDQTKAAESLGRAEMMAVGMGRGRLDLSQAVRHVSDTTPPTVSILNPASGVVFGNILITASASDNVGVAGVTFLLDNNPLGAEATAAPYQLMWVTGTVPNGTHAVTAVARDAAGNTATASVSLTVSNTIAPQTPAITWPAPATIASGTALSAAQLNATASVPGTFVYMPAAGTVLPAGAGQTLSVTFTPADAAHYTTATATAAITVLPLKATPAITWSAPAAIAYGTPLSATQLDATSSVPGTFAYTPALGTVLLAGAGQTLAVTFTPTDAANYTTATATVAIRVVSATPTLTWPTPAAIAFGTALGATQLNATASVPGTFAYAPALGAVLNAGTGQTLSVTFTPTDTANYTTATAIVTMDVTKAVPTVTWPAPTAIAYGTALSATQLNATASVSGTFVYSPALGTVQSAGAGQTLSVTFTPADAANYTTATATVAITVLQATPAITWSAPAAIASGTALSATQLNATANVPGAFVYTPALGTVLPAGAGQTLSVTFTPTDAANYTSVTATVAITVLKATPAITWPAPATIAYGTALSTTQLDATASVPGTFVYTPALGTVLPAGASQTLSVTFTPTDAANYTTATATVAITVLKATPAITWPVPATIAYGTALSATQLNATASAPGTFVYAPALGTVLPAGAGQTLSVTFTPADAADYAIATATVAITVLQATPAIAWPAPTAIAYGTALSATQLNATASVPGTLVYTPALGTVLPAGAGRPLSVTFTPTDAANYTTATATVPITVLQATPAITWPAPGAIAFGTALSATQLNATAIVPGTFVYTPALGMVLPAGAGQTLSVTFMPTDAADYTAATATVAITVAN